MASMPRKFESKLALVMALDLLDFHLNDEMASILEEITVSKRVADTLEIPEEMSEQIREWRYTYNCVFVPSCCAGECCEYEREPVGYIDIMPSETKVYRISIDTLVLYEWDI